MNVTEKRKIEKLIARQIEAARRALYERFVQDVDDIKVVVPANLKTLVKQLKSLHVEREKLSNKTEKLLNEIQKTTPESLVGISTYRSEVGEFYSREKRKLEDKIASYSHSKDAVLSDGLINSPYEMAREYAEHDRALVDFQESELIAKIYLAGDSNALQLLDRLEKSLTKIVAGF